MRRVDESIHSNSRTKESNNDSSNDHGSSGKGIEDKTTIYETTIKVVFDLPMSPSLCMPNRIKTGTQTDKMHEDMIAYRRQAPRGH